MLRNRSLPFLHSQQLIPQFSPPKKRFHAFFSSIDNFKSPQFLYLSSIGPQATHRPLPATEISKSDLAENDAINGSWSDEEVADGEDG